MMPDYRDLCIEQLADDMAAMTERAINAEADRDAYRTLSQQLLHALHHVTLERDVLREQRQIDRRREREAIRHGKAA